MGNIFPGDVLLLSIRKIVFPLCGGSAGGEVSPSLQPHLSHFGWFFSFFFLTFFLSSWVFFYLSVAPSIVSPPWADICCQAALLFCSSDFWLKFSCSFSSPTSSLTLFVSPPLSFPPALPHKHFSLIIFPFLLSLLLFLFFLSCIKFSILQSLPHNAVFHYSFLSLSL